MIVTVVTVCFNASQTISNTIKSVAQQTYTGIEHIVIDGNSHDGTQKIIQTYSDSIDCFISEPDQGIYDAMNKGIKLASGDVITFLNADDVFANEHIVQNAVDALKHSGAALTFGNVQFFDGERMVRHYSSRNFKPWKLRFGWMPPHPGSFAKRELYQNFGLFTTKLRIAADYELYVRWLLVNSVSYVRMNGANVNMAMGGASTESWSARLRLNREIVMACKMNDVYTNLFLVLTKIPFKLIELFIKPSRKMSI